MINRLVHHAEKLRPNGDSYRLKDRGLARATPTDTTQHLEACATEWSP